MKKLRDIEKEYSDTLATYLRGGWTIDTRQGGLCRLYLKRGDEARKISLDSPYDDDYDDYLQVRIYRFRDGKEELYASGERYYYTAVRGIFGTKEEAHAIVEKKDERYRRNNNPPLVDFEPTLSQAKILVDRVRRLAGCKTVNLQDIKSVAKKTGSYPAEYLVYLNRARTPMVRLHACCNEI